MGRYHLASLLAEQFVDEGFVNSEYFGGFAFCSDSPLYRINNALPQVYGVSCQRIIEIEVVYSFK
jgi:hypothetical protein